MNSIQTIALTVIAITQVIKIIIKLVDRRSFTTATLRSIDEKA